MGDVTRDGTLNKPEFLRLAALLGIPDPQEAEVKFVSFKSFFSKVFISINIISFFVFYSKKEVEKYYWINNIARLKWAK